MNLLNKWHGLKEKRLFKIFKQIKILILLNILLLKF